MNHKLTLYLKKFSIYKSFQDDYPLKKPWKPCATFDFVNNRSSRRFLHVRGLVLVFILKELPIGAT